MKFIDCVRLSSVAVAIFLGACGDDGGGDPCDRDDCVEGASCAASGKAFTCSCAAGYTGDGKASGTGCANIDECAAGTDDCAAAAACTDSDGAFACACGAGFSGDGRSGGTGCADVDECGASTAPCDSAATCRNLEGSFQCLGLYAPSPFRNLVYRLDPVTLATLETRVPALENEVVSGNVSFAEDPTDRAIYAVVKIAAGRALARFDATSSAYALVAPLADRFASITFDSAGQLYGVTGNGGTAPETLYKLDKVTGEATLVRALGAGGDGEAIQYNPDDGKIYHWSGGTSFFEAITMTEPYEVTSLSSTFNREVFGAIWDDVAKNFLVFDIASAARRFFVDGTFAAADEATFFDDLRSPARTLALPHTMAPITGPLASPVTLSSL
jgi:Calcium-binding EGF domain/EGF domain